MQHLHIRTNGYPVIHYLNTKGWVECNMQNSSDCDILHFISDYFLQIKTTWDNVHTWRNFVTMYLTGFLIQISDLAVHDVPRVWGVHNNRTKVCPWLPWARWGGMWNSYSSHSLKHTCTCTHKPACVVGGNREWMLNVSQRLCSPLGFFFCKIRSRSRDMCRRSCFCPNK